MKESLDTEDDTVRTDEAYGDTTLVSHALELPYRW
jgi:hypothetical protein